MPKTITYFFPYPEIASNLKMYQDRTSQIIGFYFTRESIKRLYELSGTGNYAIYFLFDESEDEKQIYVGQSVNGVKRIEDHVRGKEFWTYAIMFVTDNNTFDKLAIDYLEYRFINIFKKSSYVITNTDLRPNKPNISVFDEANLEVFIDQIKFLLSAERIKTDEVIIASDSQNNLKYYFPSSKYNAKIYIQDGQFVLIAGSELRRPPESAKDWKDKRHYERNNEIIDSYLTNEKAVMKDGKIITIVNLAFTKPSKAADLVSGQSENGWKFFKGLEEVR